MVDTGRPRNAAVSHGAAQHAGFITDGRRLRSRRFMLLHEPIAARSSPARCCGVIARWGKTLLPVTSGALDDVAGTVGVSFTGGTC